MADERIATVDLGWLILAYKEFKGYAPFKAETIAALRELHELRLAADAAKPDGDADA